MKTLSLFVENPPSIPSQAAWYLASIAESKGKQELFRRQSPQKLTALRQHALIQSAVSSNRIEGITVDASRVATVVLGKPLLRDRNEEEVSGYREALKMIHEKGKLIEVAEPAFLDLHRLARGGTGDAGTYKEKDGDIFEKHPDGSSRVRFRTVPAAETPCCMRELVRLWQQSESDAKIPYMVLLAAFNLDFLCIHPFRDGNGRVSRLLMLLQSYHGGLEVGRYISIERLIEENKDRYFETLEESSRNWHEGRHDPWPYIRFVLYLFKTAYQEFEERLGQMDGIRCRGEKRSMVEDVIKKTIGTFSVRELEDRCPGVSIDMIRRVLKDLQKENKVECLGKGQSAKWQRIKTN
jgi:Fic family protein